MNDEIIAQTQLTKHKRFDILDLAQTKVIKEADLYDDEIHLIFNPNAKGSQPRYTANGQITPGVTSVLGVINKEMLKQWAADMAAKSYEQQILQALAQEIPITETFLKRASATAAKAYLVRAELAADLGSLVHYGTEVYDTDQTILIFTDDLANQQLARYIKWRQDTQWEVIAIEKLIYSKNHHYAGTLDRLFKLPDGRIALMDVKTSKVSSYNQKGVYDDYHMQVGGYTTALEEMGIHVDCAGFINPDKEWGEFHVHMLDDAAFANAKEAWLNTKRMWDSHNLAKYHNKKQNSLTPKQWYSIHRK